MKRYDSRTADKFVVRLPDDMRADVEALATFEDRSMNSVTVQAIRNHLDFNRRQELLLDALRDASMGKRQSATCGSEQGSNTAETQIQQGSVCGSEQP
ncbi:ribbon-helix-helix domain-containing protein [Pseudomonas ogarae]|uniref:CopG family ribbon-helix-helix protein n=1 Tax=Pseudomonas ogarae (strain DSM 112162 / CECT 30235 / F113) TaxID=1114970 RepID=UPI001644E6FD|nr:ribbon-helix-helix domain-containing protein [Pseudomonas zarinae]